MKHSLLFSSLFCIGLLSIGSVSYAAAPVEGNVQGLQNQVERLYINVQKAYKNNDFLIELSPKKEDIRNLYGEINNLKERFDDIEDQIALVMSIAQELTAEYENELEPIYNQYTNTIGMFMSEIEALSQLNLPVHEVNNNSSPAIETQVQCSICQDEFISSQAVNLGCNHHMCTDCLDQYINNDRRIGFEERGDDQSSVRINNDVCPVCRAQLDKVLLRNLMLSIQINQHHQ